MKDTLKIIDGWDQITVGQYEELIEIQKEHPDESAKYIVEYLYDVEDADKLPLPEYVAMVSGLKNFIDTPLNKAKLTPTASYTLNGKLYRVDITPSAFTTGQYIDLTNYIEKKAKLSDLLSVVVIPDGKSYNDGYDIQEAKRDIECMRAVDGFAVVGFFGRWSRASIKTFLRSLTSQMKRKVGKEKVQELEKEVATLLRLLASYPTF